MSSEPTGNFLPTGSDGGNVCMYRNLTEWEKFQIGVPEPVDACEIVKKILAQPENPHSNAVSRPLKNRLFRANIACQLGLGLVQFEDRGEFSFVDRPTYYRLSSRKKARISQKD